MMDLLSDRVGHSMPELLACLADAEMGDPNTVHVYLHGLRKLLASYGDGIACERLNGHTTWRLTSCVGAYSKPT